MEEAGNGDDGGIWDDLDYWDVCQSNRNIGPQNASVQVIDKSHGHHTFPIRFGTAQTESELSALEEKKHVVSSTRRHLPFPYLNKSENKIHKSKSI
ncbi:hypothetical protein D7D25_02675 [Proteiniphilum sp. X52]|nr:hypothetical protein D7D25_02675 [Proteiniphilum sp. X52]